MGNTLTRHRDEILSREPIGKLLIRLSVPAVIGMLVYSLYNLIDTIFIGRGVSALAIGGLAIVFPIQVFIMAIGTMLGIGAASVISRSLGAGEREKAYRAGGNALLLAMILGLVIMGAGRTFIYPLLRLFGSTETLQPYAHDYLSMILLGSAFTSTALAGNNIIRSEGKATIAMVSLLIGTGLNIPLDYFLIFVVPMGIRGAALATVISQGLSFFFVTGFFLSGKSSLQFKKKHLLPDLQVIREIMALGVPVGLRQGCKVILFIIVNNSLRKFSGDMAIAAFGAIFRLLAFMLLPVMGLGQGFQPIAGYNYGAQNYKRVKQVLRLSILVSSSLALLIFGVMMLFPEFLISLFSSDPGLLQHAIPALRLIILATPLLGLQSIGSIYFFAIGKAVPALFLGLSRQVLFLIPLVLILSHFFQVNGIWAAFPLADVLSTLITMIWMTYELKKTRKQ